MIYNQKKEIISEVGELNAFQPSFLLAKEEVNSEKFLEKIKKQIQEILTKRFPGQFTKQEIVPKMGRLNFACPYCGDSATDPWKKRGNFYTESFDYHCFNCGQHATYESLAKTFAQEIELCEINFLRQIAEKTLQNRTVVGNLDPTMFMQTNIVTHWAVDRVELMIKLGCAEARGSSIENYLRKRLQFDMDNFGWNEKSQKLFIFNLTPDKKKVLGFQIRNFKAQPKYLTFKLSRIYTEIINQPIPDDISFEYADQISTTFGILNLDINKNITVFEGPLDSFLFNNAVAVCSVKNDFPFDINVRWMFDYDIAGRQAAIERLKNGESVFLWKKFLSDFQTEINTTKKIDLTDLMVYVVRKKIKIPNFEKYFSSLKYDIYWI
jgi:predicted RNA-binding Zn-ribbon protein involved in translation (DUF1610 family)